MIEFVVLDVDDVLTEMDGVLGVAERAVIAPLAPVIGRKVAEGVQADLSRNYATLRDQLRAAPGEDVPGYRALRADIERWQRALTEAGHEVKQWSRDTLIAIALEAAGAPLDPALIEAASRAYWTTVAEESRLYDDARTLLLRLAERGIEAHLSTNSDGFLRLDPGATSFRYDPPWAIQRKIDRMRALSDFGIRPDQVTVGDPIGKPSPIFYRRVLAEFGARIGRPIDPARLLTVGDSLTMDVLPLIELGAARGALLDRSRATAGVESHPQHERVSIVSSLAAIDPLLED